MQIRSRFRIKYERNSPTTLLLFSEKEEVNYKRSLKNQVIENKSSLNPLINSNQNK